MIANDKNLVNDNAAEGTNEYNALIQAIQDAQEATAAANAAAAQYGDLDKRVGELETAVSKCIGTP